MVCPLCGADGDPAAQVGSVAVCDNCGASVVIEDEGIRRATRADTTTLNAEELQTLRKARNRTR